MIGNQAQYTDLSTFHTRACGQSRTYRMNKSKKNDIKIESALPFNRNFRALTLYLIFSIL